MTRPPSGALPTPRNLFELIFEWKHNYILLDVAVAALLGMDVSILNDRMRKKMVALNSQVRATRCVVRLGRGRVHVWGYTQAGIIEAINIVSPQWRGTPLSDLLQLVGRAFAMKEVECGVLGRRPARVRVSAVHSQRVGARRPSDVLQLRLTLRDRPQPRHTVTILGR